VACHGTIGLGPLGLWGGERGDLSKAGHSDRPGVIDLPRRGRFVVRIVSPTKRIISGIDNAGNADSDYTCWSPNGQRTMCDATYGSSPPIGWPWMFRKGDTSYTRASLLGPPVDGIDGGVLIAYGVCNKL
jgi:hypothetical protein